MDILIKGMEMPKSCEDCWMTYEGDSDNCPVVNESVCQFMVAETRHPRCPLVALPEHGSRCAEINAVVSAITKCFADCKAKGIKPTTFIMSVYIGKVPTILEANDGIDK